MPSSDFYWTVNEIQTKQGFYVGPGNKDYDEDEVRFLVLRYQDERSSKLCQDIDNMARSNGGVVIYDQSAIKKGLSAEYRTGLFHENCRCRLVPKPKAIEENKQIDETDFMMSIRSSAIREAERERLREFLSDENYKRVVSDGYNRRANMVYDVNESGKHYLHDRRGRRGLKW
jgi:hypothetical protein